MPALPIRLLLATSTLSSFVSAWGASPIQQLSLYSTPVHDAVRGAYDEIYVVKVSVGSPAKEFNFTVDYSWDASFLFPPQTQLLCYANIPLRQYYEERASTTGYDPHQNYSGLNLGEPYTSYCNCFFTGTCKDDVGKFLYDSFQIGDQVIDRTPFAYAVNDGNVLNAGWPSDGILGVRPWAHVGLPAAYSTTERIFTALRELSAFNKRLISVYLEPCFGHLESPVVGGVLTVGVKDTTHCESTWSYQYGSTTSVTIQSVTLGTYQTDRGAFPAAGQLSSTSMYIYAPKFVMEAFMSQLGAGYYWPTDNYYVPCEQIGSLPDLLFGLQGFTYRLSAKDYIRELHIDFNNAHCTVMFAESLLVEGWMLGTTFLRPYCHALDFDKNAVAFARLLS